MEPIFLPWLLAARNLWVPYKTWSQFTYFFLWWHIFCFKFAFFYSESIFLNMYPPKISFSKSNLEAGGFSLCLLQRIILKITNILASYGTFWNTSWTATTTSKRVIADFFFFTSHLMLKSGHSYGHCLRISGLLLLAKHFLRPHKTEVVLLSSPCCFPIEPWSTVYCTT